jgi:Icc-related predicted phosphoesterase
MRVLGLPYVTDLPRWAFNTTEDALFKYIRSCGSHDIIVSHMPVHGILDLRLDGRHVGSKPYRNYIHNCIELPKHWISGHIHEGYGTAELYGCKFYNVAMCNREYMHTNPPMVIDL